MYPLFSFGGKKTVLGIEHLDNIYLLDIDKNYKNWVLKERKERNSRMNIGQEAADLQEDLHRPV